MAEPDWEEPRPSPEELVEMMRSDAAAIRRANKEAADALKAQKDSRKGK